VRTGATGIWGAGRMSDLTKLSAVEAAQQTRAGKIGAAELVEAALARVAAVDGKLRAFMTVNGDGARAAAQRLDALPAAQRGPLHGLPIAFKDLIATAGVRSTYGSLVYADNVPEENELFVDRTLKAGAVMLGKTVTPEFGYGALCQNRLAGPTANPYDPTRTSGGSSGGAAVAVCTGMAAIAHGTDFGGSCRMPASLSGVVGLRPSAGLIANPAKPLLWDDLNVHGVLARNVQDVALLLSVAAGRDLADPTSLRAGSFTMPALRPEPLANLKVAARLDLGMVPIDREVRPVLQEAVRRVAGLYGNVDEASPDFRGAMDAFMRMRGCILYRTLGHLLTSDRDKLTPSVVWNIERGVGVTADDYLKAEQERSRIWRSIAAFFREYDIFLCVTTSIAAFPNSQGDVLLIDGKPMASIIDYMAPTATISLFGLPALSIPCGFTASGLPIGLQIVARPFEEEILLHFAYTLQENLGFAHRWPPL
jgi:amidase